MKISRIEFDLKKNMLEPGTYIVQSEYGVEKIAVILQKGIINWYSLD